MTATAPFAYFGGKTRLADRIVQLLPEAELDKPFDPDAHCSCGHAHHRHDMGHGCLDCRCRGFVR